jgi:carboxymethylenebutenolidase
MGGYPFLIWSLDMTSETALTVAAADGDCPTWLYRPAGDGPFPGVIELMDGPGMRPAVRSMGRRLAEAGYVALVPDLFYRAGPYDPIDPKVVFTNKDLREAHRARFMAPTTPAKVMADMPAFFDALSVEAEGPFGVVGYCMGGRLALIAAGTYPDRFALAASFHGGGLANDTPTSPHLLAGKMTAKIYVGGAIEDANFDDDQKARLDAALGEAGLDYTIETYPARHGWCLPDMPVHDPEQAERHWERLIGLLDQVYG